MNIASARPQICIGPGILLCLLFLFSACAGSSSAIPQLETSTSPIPTTPPVNSPAAKSTNAATNTLGEQACPASVQAPSYWSSLLTLPDGSTIARIACASLRGRATLQALVLVGHDNTARLLDIYVFDQVERAHPIQIFKLERLYKGDAKISTYNTIITAEADMHSRINKDQPDAAVQQDLFREFKWSEAADKFEQVAFPGIYPDLTRWQAEADQRRVNTGVDTWKRDALEVAKHFGDFLLTWNGATATMVSGGGIHDLAALVALKSPHPGGALIHIYLSRLQGQPGNMWEITRADAANSAITTPTERSGVSSPLDVTGKGIAFEGVVGDIVVYDHLYDRISTTPTRLTGSNGNGPTTYSAHVHYTTSYIGGAQEGFIAHYTQSNADGSIATVALVKVLLE